MSTPPPLPDAPLVRHQAAVATLASHLDDLASLAEFVGLAPVAERCRSVAARSQDRSFRVAIVGEFKRGKSTLVNALLGAEVLPADIAPCSATLNRVTWGESPRVTLRYRPTDGEATPDAQISIEELADHVTQLTPEAAQRARTIAEAVVHYPTPFCRDRTELIDTPGLNDAESLSQITLDVLPQADAALVVISAQSPFSQVEGDLMNRILGQDLGRVLLVVNRMDLLRKEADRERVLETVRARVQDCVAARAQKLFADEPDRAAAFLAQVGPPRVFGLSAADALEARLEGDAAALESSGYTALTEALDEALVKERGLILQRVLHGTALSAAHGIHRQLSLQRALLGVAEDQRAAAHSEATARLSATVATLQAELRRLTTSKEALLEEIQPRCRALSDRLEAEADAVVTDFETPAFLESKDVGKRLQQAIEDRLTQVLHEESEALQVQIATSLQEEMARTAAFAESFDVQLSQVEQDALDLATSGVLSGRSSQAAATASVPATAAPVAMGVAAHTGAFFVGATALFAGGGALGGASTGYEVAGAKGAALGAVVGGATSYAWSIGTLFALHLALGISAFSMPIAVPIVVGSSLLGSVHARQATRLVFHEQWFEAVRERVREAVRQEMEKGRSLRHMELQMRFEEHIETLYGGLAARIEADGETALAAARQAVDALTPGQGPSAGETAERLQELDAQAHLLKQVVTELQGLRTEG